MGKRIHSVTIHEAKTQLSRLLQQVQMGKTIIICKGQNPIAQLSPLVQEQGSRKLGSEIGKITIADDFNETPKELISFFQKERK